MGVGKQQLRRQYFQEQLALARKAANALRYSYSGVQASLPLPAEIPEDLAVQLEALTARFARLSDLLLQKLFRAQDALLLEDEGTLRVLCPRDICEFRATPMRQDKEQAAGNGVPLAKACDAVLAHLGGSLRARRETAIRGVARTWLRITKPASARLAADRFPPC